MTYVLRAQRIIYSLMSSCLSAGKHAQPAGIVLAGVLPALEVLLQCVSGNIASLSCTCVMHLSGA
jgi:hypothetical protein